MRNIRRTYSEIFFGTNGLGPFDCAFCHKMIDDQDLDIHHQDENHANDDPDNLVPAHHSCHISFHKKAWWAAGNKIKIPEYRTSPDFADIRSAMSKRGWSDERRKAQGASMRQLWADPVWADRQRTKLKEAWKKNHDG